MAAEKQHLTMPSVTGISSGHKSALNLHVKTKQDAICRVQRCRPSEQKLKVEEIGRNARDGPSW